MYNTREISRSEINKEFLEEKLEIDLSELETFPRYFLIETIFACNADCIMCPAKTSPRKRGKMSEPLLMKILDEIAEYREQVRKVQFYLHGEPCMDKQLPRWVSEAKKRGIGQTHLATNGSLLTPEMSSGLLDAGLDQMYVAIDAFKEETFSEIRKGLSLKVVRENVIRFLEMREAMGKKTRVRLLMVVQEKNVDEVSDWISFWKPLLSAGDELFANKIRNWGGQIDTGSFYEAPDDRYPCVLPFGTMSIMADGKVPLCCEDVFPKYDMGDLNTQSIKQIWDSQHWRDICKRHLKGLRGDMALCKGCDVFSEDKYLHNIKIGEKGV